MNLHRALLFPSLNFFLKKNHPEKNSLYFGKWNVLLLMLKNFRKQKPRNGNPKKFLIFPEKELFSLNIKKMLIFSQKKPFLIFPKTEPCIFSRSFTNKRNSLREIYYTSGNEVLVFSQKKVFLIFREKVTRKNFSIFQKTKLSELKKWKKKHTRKMFLFSQMFLFRHCFRVFSLLIAFFHFTVSWDAFISPTFFTVTVFCYIVFVLLYRYGFERAFILRHFLSYTSSRHFVQPAFIKASLRLTV